MEIPGFVAFELDLVKAVLTQLIPRLDAIQPAPLISERTSQLPDAQGIYLLLHRDAVRYVGKTDSDAGLRLRLSRHVNKFEHRNGIKPSDVEFKAVQILVLTAMDIEAKLIKHFKPEWNGSGFGSNDPGRERETTNKPASGFDSQFPIDIDRDVRNRFDPVGEMTVSDLLWRLKDALPYDFRYETARGGGGRAYKTNPHPDTTSSIVDVPKGIITARRLLQLAVGALPQGWQATAFVSHVILYKEAREYKHGKKI